MWNGVMWNVAEMHVECCLMQHVESYDVMRNVVVWNCGDENCGICSALCDCCVATGVKHDAMCCDVRCGCVM